MAFPRGGPRGIAPHFPVEHTPEDKRFPQDGLTGTELMIQAEKDGGNEDPIRTRNQGLRQNALLAMGFKPLTPAQPIRFRHRLAILVQNVPKWFHFFPPPSCCTIPAAIAVSAVSHSCSEAFSLASSSFSSRATASSASSVRTCCARACSRSLAFQ